MKRLEKMGFEHNFVIIMAIVLSFCFVAFVDAALINQELGKEPVKIFYNTKIIDNDTVSDNNYNYFSIVTPLTHPFNSILVEVTKKPKKASDNFTNLRIGACYNITATVKSQLYYIEEAECL
jgi:hypothetical protein